MKPLLYLAVLAGILIILLLGILYLKSVEAQDPDGQGAETQEPIVGEPVTPGVSEDAGSLPTAQPHQPGEPVPEVNPRQRGTIEQDHTGEALTKGTTHLCQH